MIILRGVREIKIAQEKRNIICPHCENDGTTEMFVKLKYFHVFFIPFFPFSKFGKTICEHCKLTLDEGEFPKAWVVDHFYPLYGRARTPWWTFFILILFVVFIFALLLQKLVG
jgi:hypothetical protein